MRLIDFKGMSFLFFNLISVLYFQANQSSPKFLLMNSVLIWKRGFFSSSCKVFLNQSIGAILKSSFDFSTVYLDLNTKRYEFRTKGLFKPNTVIVDVENQSIVGNITYNGWSNKAFVHFQNEMAFWKMSGIGCTSWSMMNPVEGDVVYKGSITDGTFFYEGENLLYPLTGLFVRYYFYQVSLSMLLAVMVPLVVIMLTR